MWGIEVSHVDLAGDDESDQGLAVFGEAYLPRPLFHACHFQLYKVVERMTRDRLHLAADDAFKLALDLIKGEQQLILCKSQQAIETPQHRQWGKTYLCNCR